MNDDSMLQAIPEELLESIAGGVLTDDDRAIIRKTVETCMECGWSSETTYKFYVVAIKLNGTAEDYADLGEIRSIINQVYGE